MWSMWVEKVRRRERHECWVELVGVTSEVVRLARYVGRRGGWTRRVEDVYVKGVRGRCAKKKGRGCAWRKSIGETRGRSGLMTCVCGEKAWRRWALEMGIVDVASEGCCLDAVGGESVSVCGGILGLGGSFGGL